MIPIGRSKLVARRRRPRRVAAESEHARLVLEVPSVGDHRRRSDRAATYARAVGYAFGTIDEMGDGVFRKVRQELGVTAFGVNVLVIPPGVVGAAALPRGAGRALLRPRRPRAVRAARRVARARARRALPRRVDDPAPGDERRRRGSRDARRRREGRLRRPRRPARGSVEAGLEADGCAAELAEAAAVEREADHRGQRGGEAAGGGREDHAAAAVVPPWPAIASAPIAAPW